MRKSFILTVCVAVMATAAFATDPSPYLTGPANPRGEGGYYGTDDTFVDNLCTASSQITNGLAGCGYFSSWLALDYTPTAAVVVNKLFFHYIYNSSPLKNTLNFRLYQGTSPGGSLIRSWDVPASGYTEVNTGWVAFSRAVYRAEVTIPDQSLSPSTKYWFAYTSANTASPNIVYWCVRADSIKEDMVWWYLSASWGSSAAKGYGTVEQSYKIDGRLTGIAPASVGKVKALYY